MGCQYKPLKFPSGMMAFARLVASFGGGWGDAKLRCSRHFVGEFVQCSGAVKMSY